ncbi:threonine/homoserine/homoserine lactone efflux protein [Nocardia tenerifensis]|uniref:Threonine/homoserine/homoserine lactone efflux protein n=1 Tax=Nocardia tenerifensis TaxID=228006 RepID=A0A318JXX2_9NOCA|nr:LysE family translocator [Nocardia tenerifensis]PXX59873.1 threonine/homoserine/homoserine lactone efflux protein [Nocardia tenerifensis]
MALGYIAAFWTVSVLLILVPGADWAYAITAGLRERSVVPAVGGLLLGYVALTAVVAAGVAAVVDRNPSVLTALTVFGGVYLMWLGGTTLATASTLAAMPGEAEPAPWGASVLRGIGISGLNPKALLLFLALLPQFTDRTGSWPLAAQIGTLGLIHTLSCAAIYLCVGVLARTVLRARPSAARLVTRVSGVAMIVIGILLLVERVL